MAEEDTDWSYSETIPKQTISTLRFASQAKTIQNHATVNEVLDDKAQINRLTAAMQSQIGLKLDLHTNWAQIWLQESEITKTNLGSLVGIFNTG